MALASIVTALLPAFVIAGLLLLGVQDPFGRVPTAIWVVPALGPLAAVILGHTARRRAHLTGERATLATIGAVLGYLGLAVYLIIAVLALAVAGIVGEP